MPTLQRAGRPRYENSSSLYFAILNGNSTASEGIAAMPHSTYLLRIYP